MTWDPTRPEGPSGSLPAPATPGGPHPAADSRDFRRLFLGRSISDFGDEIVAVGRALPGLRADRSTLAVGLLGLCELVPVFVFPIVGGAFGRRVERRRFMIWSHVFLAVMSCSWR